MVKFAAERSRTQSGGANCIRLLCPRENANEQCLAFGAHNAVDRGKLCFAGEKSKGCAVSGDNNASSKTS